jgi:hypothetical protein
MPLGTVRLPGLPIQDKGLQVVALPGLMLPAIGPKGRAHHIDVILTLCGDEELRVHITAIE